MRPSVKVFCSVMGMRIVFPTGVLELWQNVFPACVRFGDHYSDDCRMGYLQQGEIKW